VYENFFSSTVFPLVNSTYSIILTKKHVWLLVTLINSLPTANIVVSVEFSGVQLNLTSDSANQITILGRSDLTENTLL
jgi:hypothetical protein